MTPFVCWVSQPFKVLITILKFFHWALYFSSMRFKDFSSLLGMNWPSKHGLNLNMADKKSRKTFVILQIKNYKNLSLRLVLNWWIRIKIFIIFQEIGKWSGSRFICLVKNKTELWRRKLRIKINFLLSEKINFKSNLIWRNLAFDWFV